MGLAQIPSLNLLRGFHAAGRHASFSDAAEELGVTQGAVSRQIKALEDRLGVVLFDRSARHPRLTEAGQRYWGTVHRAFRDLEAATAALIESEETRAVTVSVLPTFAMRWLIPRLGDFQRLHPDIEVRVMTSNTPEVSSAGGFDLAVVFAPEPPPASEGEFFVEEVSVAVCHPDLVNQDEALTPRDVLKHTLLANGTRPDGWRRWFAEVGLDPAGSAKIVTFKHFYLTIQAALNRMGIALVPRLYVENELRNGQLIAPFNRRGTGYGAYYLMPASAEDTEPTKLFRQWLLRVGNPEERRKRPPGPSTSG